MSPPLVSVFPSTHSPSLPVYVKADSQEVPVFHHVYGDKGEVDHQLGDQEEEEARRLWEGLLPEEDHQNEEEAEEDPEGADHALCHALILCAVLDWVGGCDRDGHWYHGASSRFIALAASWALVHQFWAACCTSCSFPHQLVLACSLTGGEEVHEDRADQGQPLEPLPEEDDTCLLARLGENKRLHHERDFLPDLTPEPGFACCTALGHHPIVCGGSVSPKPHHPPPCPRDSCSASSA